MTLDAQVLVAKFAFYLAIVLAVVVAVVWAFR